MSTMRLAALVLSGLLAVTACAEGSVEDVVSGVEDVTNSTVADEVEETAVDLAEEVQQEMDTVAAEIQDSEAAAELEAAWGDLQTELVAAIGSMQTDGSIQTEGVEKELADFQKTLDEAGDAVGPELESAWQSLRDKIEQLMS